MPVITCQHPDCVALIHYKPENEEIPIFCPKHMIGREHRGYKENRYCTKPKVLAEPEPKMVTLFCSKCKRHETILESVWIANHYNLICPGCKSRGMVYHGDVKLK